ncbi:MAG: PIN domain-containing protein [Candidatus Thorarchaeota archaeon]
MPLTVVLDTNFLTVPAQFGVDIFSETERILERNVVFVVLSSVVRELERKLSDSRGSEASKFRVALGLVERCSIVDYARTGVPVDDQLLDYARSVRGILATNDKDLRTRASQEKIPVLFLRSKKRLDLLGSVI